MSTADKYRLCTSPLTGKIFISAISKKNPNVMTDDRRVVPESEFYEAIIQHVDAKLDEDKDTLTIRLGEDKVLEITIFREALAQSK
jgi:hypothetical protein